MKRQELKQKKNKNWWKISLLSLIALLVLVIAILGFRVLSPIPEANKKSNIIDQNNSIFNVSMTRNQVNRTSEEYVNEFLKNDDIKYKFNVDKKHANILGSVKFIGSKINFKLILDPYVKTNGDVQLRAKSLKVGSLPVPVGFVMNYIGSSYHLPSWVKMNSKNHIVDLKLTQYETETGYSIKAKKIDLKNNDVKIEVFKKGNN